MEASRLLAGSGVVSIRFMKSVESFRYEGSCFTYGWSHVSTNCEIDVVLVFIS